MSDPEAMSKAAQTLWQVMRRIGAAVKHAFNGPRGRSIGPLIGVLIRNIVLTAKTLAEMGKHVQQFSPFCATED